MALVYYEDTKWYFREVDFPERRIYLTNKETNASIWVKPPVIPHQITVDVPKKGLLGFLGFTQKEKYPSDYEVNKIFLANLGNIFSELCIKIIEAAE